MQAWLQPGQLKIVSVKNIFSYETLSETEWAAPFGDDAFIPDLLCKYF